MEYCILIVFIYYTIASNQTLSQALVKKITLDSLFKVKLTIK